MTKSDELPLALALKAIDCSNDGIVITAGNHSNRPIIYVNEAFCRLTGYTREEILGRDCRFLQGPKTNRQELQTLNRSLLQGKSDRVRVLNYRKDGSTFWNELSVSPVTDEQGAITHHIGVQKDITRQVENEAELNHLLEQLNQESRTDTLTGLLNRRGFGAVASPVWGNAVRTGAWLSVFFIDIDNFKQINDRYGHHTGDQCLKEISDRLAARMNRESDVVARYGGEEFIVLAPGVDQTACRTLGDRILEDLRFSLPGGSGVNVTASIGAHSLVPSPKDRLLSVIQQADRAMYASKQSGRNRISYFFAQKGV